MFWIFISTPFLSLRLMLHLSHLPIPPLLHGSLPTPRTGGYQSLWLIFRIRRASGEDGFNRGEQCISKKRVLALSPLKQEARFSDCAACWFNTLQSWAAWPTHILHSTRSTTRQWQPLKRVKQGAKYYVCGFCWAWKWRESFRTRGLGEARVYVYLGKHGILAYILETPSTGHLTLNL